MSRHRAPLLLSLTVTLGLLLAPTGARAEEEETLEGLWRGTYLCSQGWTGMDLELTRQDPVDRPASEGREGDQVVPLRATYRFYEIARNPGVAKGSYTMTGTFSPETQRLELRQDSWIQRPPNYVMVDLAGRLQGDALAGKVDGYSCGAFQLERVQPGDEVPTASSWLMGETR